MADNTLSRALSWTKVARNVVRRRLRCQHPGGASTTTLRTNRNACIIPGMV